MPRPTSSLPILQQRPSRLPPEAVRSCFAPLCPCVFFFFFGGVHFFPFFTSVARRCPVPRATGGRRRALPALGRWAHDEKIARAITVRARTPRSPGGGRQLQPRGRPRGHGDSARRRRGSPSVESLTAQAVSNKAIACRRSASSARSSTRAAVCSGAKQAADAAPSVAGHEQFRQRPAHDRLRQLKERRQPQ